MVKVLSNIPVKFIKDQGTERKINVYSIDFFRPCVVIYGRNKMLATL